MHWELERMGGSTYLPQLVRETFPGEEALTPCTEKGGAIGTYWRQTHLDLAPSV